jgi:hypothetical protein
MPTNLPTNVLSTRRALLGDPLSLQVQGWLRPLYLGPIGRVKEAAAKTTVKSVVAILGQMVSTADPYVKKDSNLQKALQSLSGYISSPLSADYIKVFNTVKRPKASQVSTFVSVVYARALVLMLSSSHGGANIVSDLKQTLANPGSVIEKHLAAQKNLDANFIGHLVACAEIEAQLDPHFQTITDRAHKLFVATHMPSSGAHDPFSDPGATLELLGPKNQGGWWHLPANVAFAMTISS